MSQTLRQEILVAQVKDEGEACRFGSLLIEEIFPDPAKMFKFCQDNGLDCSRRGSSDGPWPEGIYYFTKAKVTEPHLTFVAEVVSPSSTIATRFKAKAKELMPHLGNLQTVEDHWDDADAIDEYMCSVHGEFIYGVACVILSLLEQEDQA